MQKAIAGVLRSLVKIERGELAAVLLSFALVLVLMTSYSLLKPVRDSMPADWGNVGLAVTWTINFGFSLFAVALYGSALTYIRFRVMVPGIYVFFSLTFVALYVIRSLLADPVLANKGFYVWVSVFSLFNLSVFWSFMTDIYSKSQARRVFGFIAAGTTVGAILGPSLTASLVDELGADGLLLLSASLLIVPVIVIPVLRRLNDAQGRDPAAQSEQGARLVLGTNPFSGFSILFTDRYLLGIAAFILFYVTINTFVYFELQDLTREYSLEFRAKIWSWIEISTNVLTLITAALVTSRIVIRLGMPTALAMVPSLIAVGILALVAAPVLIVLAIFHITRRVGNYAITRPSREMLFTVLNRETRFKAKPIIDVAVYRGGDVLTAWLFTLLADKLGLGLAGIALVIGGVAIAWTLIAIWLGRSYRARAEHPGIDNQLSQEGASHGVA